MRGRSILIPVLFGVLAVCALAAGCGRHESSGPLEVRLAYFPNVTHAAALVGTADGEFAKALGPKVRLTEQTFNAGPAEIEALFAGQVDVGYIGPGPAVNGYLKSHGKALRIIAGASSGGASLVVRDDSGIADVKGLAGKRVADPQTGGTQDLSLRHALKQAGLTSTDKGGTVSVLPTANPDTLSLFVKKEIDAAWVPEPWVARLVKEGHGRILIDERDLWPGKQFATTVIIARTEFLAQHPAEVRGILAGHLAAVQRIRSNPVAERKVIGDRIKQLTGKALADDVLASALSRTDVTYDPLEQTVLTFADWSHDLGFQKEGRAALGGLFDLKPLNEELKRAGLEAVQ